MECSLSDFSVHGIFQARILEWAAFSYSRGLSQPRDQTLGISFIGRQIFFTTEAPGSLVNNPPANAGDLRDERDAGSISGMGRSPGGGHGNPFFLGESHGQRSLAGYSPWSCKESDMTE